MEDKDDKCVELLLNQQYFNGKRRKTLPHQDCKLAKLAAGVGKVIRSAPLWSEYSLLEVEWN